MSDARGARWSAFEASIVAAVADELVGAGSAGGEGAAGVVEGASVESSAPRLVGGWEDVSRRFVPEGHRAALAVFAWPPERLLGLRHWSDRLDLVVVDGEGTRWALQALELSVLARRLLGDRASMREIAEGETALDRAGVLRGMSSVRPESPTYFGALSSSLVSGREEIWRSRHEATAQRGISET